MNAHSRTRARTHRQTQCRPHFANLFDSHTFQTELQAYLHFELFKFQHSFHFYLPYSIGVHFTPSRSDASCIGKNAFEICETVTIFYVKCDKHALAFTFTFSFMQRLRVCLLQQLLELLRRRRRRHEMPWLFRACLK